ncbi:hypothetical protein AGLY_011836 [Aphis glycines]|uniref:Uncharacterized protein n=1 Tax=Aphis glycines TaxID=307491 RepID=A0A6G0TDJ7_APHGL|nr:hypothetical protein AGLY_011836 [Aphis glycines]
MSAYDWALTFSEYGVDSATNILIDAIHSLILQFVLKVNFIGSRFSSWASKKLQQLVRLKNKAHTVFKLFIERTKSSLACCLNKFSDLIRKNRNTIIPKTVSLNNLTSTNEQETVDLFASNFSSVYTSAHSILDTESLMAECRESAQLLIALVHLPLLVFGLPYILWCVSCLRRVVAFWVKPGVLVVVAANSDTNLRMCNNISNASLVHYNYWCAYYPNVSWS